MRKRTFALGAFAGLLPTPTATWAAPLNFSCAAPLGHSSQLLQKLEGSSWRVTGIIRPGRLERIPDPSQPLRIDGNNIPHTGRGAAVSITSADYGRMVSLGILPLYERDPSAERVAEVNIQFKRDEDGEYEGRLLRTIKTHGVLWERLPFSIVGDADRVVIEAGGARVEIPVALGPDAFIDFSCIGGAFAFHDLSWSVESPPRGGPASQR